MRRGPILALLLLSAGTAAASVWVPPFAAPGPLDIFGPEVARAVAAALGRAGVEVAAEGAPVLGRIEALDADRVRLRVTLGGHLAEVEGPLEEIDRLAEALATRIAVHAHAHRRGHGRAATLPAPRPASAPDAGNAPPIEADSAHDAGAPAPRPLPSSARSDGGSGGAPPRE